MDQELYSLLDYVQQHSAFFCTTPKSAKAIVSSVDNMSEQHIKTETYDEVDVSLSVANNFGESFQRLFSVDYAEDNVPFYQDPTFVKPHNYESSSFEGAKYQTVFSGNEVYAIKYMQAEENHSITDLSDCLPEPPSSNESWQVNAEFSSRYYYSTYPVTECTSQDEYISSDFTQPLTGFPVYDSTEQHVQYPQEQPPTPSTKATTEEPTSDQSDGELFSTGSDELRSVAATSPEKPSKKRRNTRLEPMVADVKSSPETSDIPKKSSRRKRRKILGPTVVSEWRCVPCNRMFILKRGLLQHNIYNHSGDKPYSCNVCGKRFHDQQVALQHEKRHTTEDKPFKCEHCTRQYHHQFDLKRHIDLHHGVSRYICKYCGKAFGRNDHVKFHEKSHENGTVKRKREHLDK